MSDSEQIVGYCFKCKAKRPLENPSAEWAANGSPGTRGTCPVCGGTIYRAGHTEAHESLPKPAPTRKAKKSRKAAVGGNSKGKAGKRRRGKLVVVESPAKARTIGRYLGTGYTVKSSVGHVRDLLRSRLSVDVENDYAPEYRVPNDKRKTVKELKQAADKAAEIFLATDPDREGEAIAWHVMESTGMEPERTKRVEFNEITVPAIKAAFNSPRSVDMDRVNAQQARRILDRLVGYKLSPLLWRKVRGRLSAGRVQSVAVRMVVDREREIERFEVEEYWTLAAELSQTRHGAQSERPLFLARLHHFKGKTPEFKSEDEVSPHLPVLEAADWRVGEVKRGKRTRRPQAPFTTSTLQQEASRRLRFGTGKTMRLAQQLYEGVDIGGQDGVGLITYMRTDSVHVAKEAQQEARTHIEQEFGSTYLPEKLPRYRTKAKAAQEAHEAVRPTSVARLPAQMKPFLKKDQFRLYKLIWERFIASQMAPAVYNTVVAEIWAGDASLAAEKRPYQFRVTGAVLRFDGFLKLYEESKPADRPDAGEENGVPADLERGEQLDLIRLLPEQHFTKPPARFSEATLVKALEEQGIGRPSTYASIISTIQQRGYAQMEERRLLPTETGLLVNDLLVEYFPDVLSADFTARLEDQLDDIAAGKPWVPVIDSFYQSFSARLAVADESIPKIDLRKEVELVGRECPVCGEPLVYREGRYGRFIGCSNFPSCRHTEQIVNKIGVSCPLDGGDIVERRTKRGRVFYGCSNYPECEWRSWKKPVAEPCQVCGGLMVQSRKDTAQCSDCGNVVEIGERSVALLGESEHSH